MGCYDGELSQLFGLMADIAGMNPPSNSRHLDTVLRAKSALTIIYSHIQPSFFYLFVVAFLAKGICGEEGGYFSVQTDVGLVRRDQIHLT